MKKWIFYLTLGLVMSTPLLVSGHRNLNFSIGYASEGVVSKSSSTNEADVSGPIVCVQTVPIKKGTISESIVVYGSVIAAPGALQTVSIPFESQVLGVMVNEGQKVSEGDILLRFEPSSDTMLQLSQARNAYALAQQHYQQMERQREQKLITNEQLLQSKKAFDQAKLRLDSMKKRGIDGESRIASSVGGLVKKIYVQEGSIVAAGNPIIDIVAQNRIEVLLGVETEDIERVQTGQAVSLTRVNIPTPTEVIGKVRRISYAVNPTTRLVDVFVTLTSPAGFLLGEAIEGKIETTAAEGLIVPRAAVLPEGDRYVLFTVKDSRAVKHTVTIGVENATEYQVMGKDLRAGEDVVVLGNYELTDGMAVTTEACK